MDSFLLFWRPIGGLLYNRLLLTVQANYTLKRTLVQQNPSYCSGKPGGLLHNGLILFVEANQEDSFTTLLDK
jgi:hypothetical protein